MRRLSSESIAEAARRIDPVFRDTPKLDCEPLSDALGCRLTLSVETVNPIRSFKGRGADYFMTRAVDGRDRRPVVCASAGNFGQAMAYAGRKHGIPVTVFAATNANRLKLSRMRALGATVVLSGQDFDAAKEAARAHGGKFVEDGRDVEISEGAATIAVELTARYGTFDAIVVPLGNGALLAGIAHVIKSATGATEVIGVCAAGAPAMAQAWRGEPISDGAATMADGIAVRVPVPEALDDLRGLVDDVLLVEEAAFVDAMALVMRHAGLGSEPAGVAGIAAMLVHRERFAGKRVASVLCGSNV
jgi:threonine dehydratase